MLHTSAIEQEDVAAAALLCDLGGRHCVLQVIESENKKDLHYKQGTMSCQR